MIYIDTSAAAKLVVRELESDALGAFLVERLTQPLASSALLYPELSRAVGRQPASADRTALAERAAALLQRIMIVPLSQDIVVNAATIGNPLVRTLDALHLATADVLRDELTALLTYDKRLADSATALGLPAASPA